MCVLFARTHTLSVLYKTVSAAVLLSLLLIRTRTISTGKRGLGLPCVYAHTFRSRNNEIYDIPLYGRFFPTSAERLIIIIIITILTYNNTRRSQLQYAIYIYVYNTCVACRERDVVLARGQRTIYPVHPIGDRQCFIFFSSPPFLGSRWFSLRVVLIHDNDDERIAQSPYRVGRVRITTGARSARRGILFSSWTV